MATVEPRIAIVGGAETLVAEALAWMLMKGGYRVVGVYPSWRELGAAMGSCRQRPQAAIVYTEDPAAGPEAVAEIKSAHPELKILLLCELATPTVVRCAIEQRTEGVVLTSDTVEETILALRNVLEGRAVMPAGWQSISAQGCDPLATLSTREREILALLASGMSNKQIAGHLTISSNTVKFHLRTIYSKLGVRNRVQAMRVSSADSEAEDQDQASEAGDQDHASEAGDQDHASEAGDQDHASAPTGSEQASATPAANS